MTLAEVAKYVRSKNAGPFWMTVDIFCDTQEAYDRLKASEVLSAQSIAGVYCVDPESIRRFEVDDLKVIKLTLPRPHPQGSRHERDMHAGQQYVQLLELDI